MFMKDAGECGWKKKKITPPIPQFEAKVRELFMLDIATVNPLFTTGCKLLRVFNDKRLII